MPLSMFPNMVSRDDYRRFAAFSIRNFCNQAITLKTPHPEVNECNRDVSTTTHDSDYSPPVKHAFHIDANRDGGGQWQPLLDVKKEIPVSATL